MASISASSTHNPVVLLVEQDPQLAGALRQALGRRGVQVLCATDARQALALMDGHPIGAAVVEARLPQSSGFDLVRSMRQHPRGATAAAVILTDVRWSPYQKAAARQQMGLLDLLVKPVDVEEVAELVLGALGPLPALSEEPPPTELPPLPLTPPTALPAAEAEAPVRQPTPSARPPATPPGPAARPRPSRRPVTVESGAVDGGDSAAAGLAGPESHSERRDVERATRAAQAGPAELRGNLTGTPFPLLLHDLYCRRATGALFLLNDPIKKIIYFKSGHPTYIKSNRLAECLGKVLVREGMITESQCKESLRRMEATTRQQGTVLIEMGVISPHDLVVGLETQLRTKLNDIFTWTRGEYLFRREAKVPADVISLDVSNAALITDGIRIAWDVPRLQATLAPFLERYPRPNPDPEMRFQELDLDAEEQEFFDQIDGSATLRQLLADSPLPQRKALTAAMVLLATAVVQPHERPLSPAELEPEDPEETLRERLAAELVQLRQGDAFDALKLVPGCTDRQVTAAHARAAQHYHPDRFHNLAGETRRLGQALFELTNRARSLIATTRDRAAYRRRPLDPVPDSGEVALQADQSRREGERLLREERYAEARQVLGAALELCPDEGDLRLLHGWAMFQSDPEEPSNARQAIRELRQAAELEPRDYRTYLYLGRIYASMGKLILSEKQFEKALQCNPDCAEALQELRVQKEKRPPRRYRV